MAKLQSMVAMDKFSFSDNRCKRVEIVVVPPIAYIVFIRAI